MMKRPQRIEGLEIRSVDREVLVYDQAHDKVHVLNKAASDILLMCDGTRSVADIAQVITDAKGVDISIVARDVEWILGEFGNLQLVGESPPGPQKRSKDESCDDSPTRYGS
jgi:hypothetical protein